jgi:hypothetical protein
MLHLDLHAHGELALVELRVRVRAMLEAELLQKLLVSA